MSYEITGTIKVIQETQTFDSGFAKREFVITTEDKYPQDVKLEFVKDKVSELDAYDTGDQVTVAFNIRGNEYKDRYYVNLSAWKISKAEGASTTPPAQEQVAVADESMPF
jgi:hypothetical protein